MLTDSPLARSAGARVLFLLSAAATAAIFLWMHSMRLNGDLRGLTKALFYFFAYEDYGATICELLILVAAVFLASRIRAPAILRAVGERPWTIAGIAAVVLSIGSLLVYHDHPLSMDEYTAYFQSQIFAAGHLTGRFPVPLMDWLIAPRFQDSLSISHADGQIASMDWPGQALIMAPFTWVGFPWACNPVLSALTLVVIHRTAMHLFDDIEAAGLALLLTIASPVIFGIGVSYYSMPADLLLNCCYALLLIRPTPGRVLGAGVVGSLALVLRTPVPHALFALPWLIWIVTRSGGFRLLALLCLGYLPMTLVLGGGWLELTNQLMTQGRAITAVTTGANVIDRLRDLASIISPPTATVLLAQTIGVAKLWVWAVPGLLVLASWGALRWRHHAICRLFAASALTTLVGYFFFPIDQGHGWGYRYFHSAWVALPLLATAAIFRPSGTQATLHGPRLLSRTFEESNTKAYLTACILLTLGFGLGWRAWQMQDFVARDLSQLPQYTGTERRVVIVDLTLLFYGEDLVQNDPWLRGDVIRMVSHGAAADQQMMARYYPTLHPIFADHHGWVWSAKPLREPQALGTNNQFRSAVGDREQ